MAESTLTIAYGDLMNAVGDFLGFGTDYTQYEAGDTKKCDDALQAGYRRFLAPPPLAGETVPHVWTFLSPKATLATSATAKDYDAPDDFGGMKGGFVYEDCGLLRPIPIVGEGQIELLRTRSDSRGKPQLVAVRPKPFSPTVGQRFEFLIWPDPDGVYTLLYCYYVIPGKLSATNKYPLGGMWHSETILEACLAAAERTANDEIGLHEAAFLERLIASVWRDREIGPTHLGYNSDTSEERWTYDRTRYSLYKGSAYGPYAP